MGTYLVRAMSQSEEDFKVFFQNGTNDVVAVGWSLVDFSAYRDIEALAETVKKAYYADNSTAPQVEGKKLNEVRRFKGMQVGDRIIVPYYNEVRLGILEEGELYDKTLVEKLDLSNQRRVKYVMIKGKYVSILRNALSEGLQRRLRVRGTTIANLSEFEEEIKRFFSDPTSGWDSQFAEAEQKHTVAWQKKLLHNITQGKTNLQAGGKGLERLVQYLLELDGYKAEVLSTRRFPGLADADVKATKSDRCNGPTNLFVQVKHHSGKTGTWGAEQLAKICELQEKDPDISDYKMVLVTSADASDELRSYCEKQDFQLIAGTELGEWIYDHLSEISPEWRTRLGIGRTGELVL